MTVPVPPNALFHLLFTECFAMGRTGWGYGCAFSFYLFANQTT
jgi:hypothetical protein